VVVDDANPTSLASEFLLNEEGYLEIHKTYSGHLQKPKCESISAYVIHPSAEGAADLLQLKTADLRRRAAELGVSLEGIDQRMNAQIRCRIRAHLGELSLEPRLVSLNDENAKRIWLGLSKYLPSLALFKSDRQSTDQDAEAQDPLKAAV
jgi:putative ATP-dependent endonuclease of the OLD family